MKKIAKDEEKAILFSPHITTDIGKIADKVMYIVNGEAKLFEKMEIIKSKYSNVSEKEILLEDILFGLTGYEYND